MHPKCQWLSLLFLQIFWQVCSPNLYLQSQIEDSLTIHHDLLKQTSCMSHLHDYVFFGNFNIIQRSDMNSPDEHRRTCFRPMDSIIYVVLFSWTLKSHVINTLLLLVRIFDNNSEMSSKNISIMITYMCMAKCKKLSNFWHDRCPLLKTSYFLWTYQFHSNNIVHTFKYTSSYYINDQL